MLSTTHIKDINDNAMDERSLESIISAQKEFAPILALTSHRERSKKLRRLRKLILNRREDIRKAIWDDFRKDPNEVDINEIFPLNTEIKHIVRNLRYWMKPKPVPTPFLFKTGRSFIINEAKGCSLIIAPWNFPLLLCLMPLIYAVAAGNTAILKPPEHAPHTSRLIKEIISSLFEPKEVIVVPGGVETAKQLLSFPFNHIHFTGSPEIGKEIMKAGSKHLATVTLELGGKSPVIIDESANLDNAAKRIAWSKFMNGGQICIAPDHVFVQETVHEAFLEKLKAYILKFYGENPSAQGPFPRMVHKTHYDKIEQMMLDGLQKGGQLVSGGDHRARDNYIGPTVIDKPPMDSILMKEEIFGPVLPIQTYSDLDELIPVLTSMEKPLISYMFSRKRKNIKRFLNETSSGGVCINHNLMTIMNPYLPFGGINNSGIGKAKGYFGYLDFTNQKAVYKHVLKWSVSDLLLPPYTNLKQKIINFAIRWF